MNNRYKKQIGTDKEVSPVVPEATDPTHAVNLGQVEQNFSDTRLSNVASDLSEAEKTSIGGKIGIPQPVKYTFSWRTGDDYIFPVEDSSSISLGFYNGKKLLESEWSIFSDTEIEVLIGLDDADVIEFYGGSTSGASNVNASYTRNLVIFDSLIYGQRLDADSGSIIDDATYCYSSEYYPVSEGAVIYTQLDYGEGSSILVFYDADKVRISGYLFQSGNLQYTVPVGAKFARVSFKLKNDRIKIFSYNNPDLTYIRGQKMIPEKNIYGGKSMYHDLKWDSVGDSITFQEKWQVHIMNRYRFNLKNLGVGGQRYSGTSGFWATAFEVGGDNAIRSDVDLVTIMGGMNDIGNDAPIGAQDSTDTNTILGGLNTFIESFYSNFPSKMLIVLSPTLRTDASGVYVNSLGDTVYTIADAIEQRCRTLGVPYVDVLRNYGVNKYNNSLFTTDGIHPNNEGAKKLAGVLMGYMDSLDNYSK